MIMLLKERARVLVQCTKCKKIKSIRKDYFKALVHDYWCNHCSPRWKPETFSDRIRLSSAHRKYCLDENFFSEINNEEKAYWLGFLAADGAITENRVRLRLARKDEEHLREFKNAVKWSGKDYIPKNNNGIEVGFRSLKMVVDLEKYFVTPRKTFTIKFPYLPKEMERHFVRGVFDADGCISKCKRIKIGQMGQKYVSFGGDFCIEGNKQFISVLQSRLTKIGLPYNSINYSGKSISRVRYGGINQLVKIYDYLYKDTKLFLKRKKELFEDIIKNYRCEKVSA